MSGRPTARLGDRHRRVVGAVDVALRTRARDDARRYATDRDAGRDVLHDYRVGADQHVIADADAADDLGSRADEDVVADARAAGHLAEVDAAERHVMTQVAVVADRHLTVDEDAAVVTDVKAAADTHVTRDVDTEADGV